MNKTEKLRVKALNAAIAYLVVERWARKKMEPLQRIVDGLNAKYGGVATFNELASEDDFKLRSKATHKLSEYAKAIVAKCNEATRLAYEYARAIKPDSKPYGNNFIFGDESGMLYVPACDMDGYPANYPLNSEGGIEAERPSEEVEQHGLAQSI